MQPGESKEAENAPGASKEAENTVTSDRNPENPEEAGEEGEGTSQGDNLMLRKMRLVSPGERRQTAGERQQTAGARRRSAAQGHTPSLRACANGSRAQTECRGHGSPRGRQRACTLVCLHDYLPACPLPRDVRVSNELLTLSNPQAQERREREAKEAAAAGAGSHPAATS